MNARVSRRAAGIEPFRVMALLARARELEAAGRDIVHLEIGEPDFPTPAPIMAAGRRALDAGQAHYTPAAGLPALREAIAEHYATTQGLHVEPSRVFITPGASGALLLAMALTLDVGDELLLTDPGYPCNRHFAQTLGISPRAVPVDAGSDYQLTAAHLRGYHGPGCRAALVASPSNPTGTVLDREALVALRDECERLGLWLLVDEIYHGLDYGPAPLPSALAVSDRALVINSFSKYFGMTGWRLGWLVVPETLVEPAERLAQNLFIAASTPAQHAALAAFSAETREILDARRDAFAERLRRFHARLQAMPLAPGPLPAGAFYLYAGMGDLPMDSETFSREALEQVGVALTPGTDFGRHHADRHLRFACTRPVSQLDEAADRLDDFLSRIVTDH